MREGREIVREGGWEKGGAKGTEKVWEEERDRERNRQRERERWNSHVSIAGCCLVAVVSWLQEAKQSSAK